MQWLSAQRQCLICLVQQQIYMKYFTLAKWSCQQRKPHHHSSMMPLQSLMKLLDRLKQLGIIMFLGCTPFSGLRAASTREAVGFCGSHRQTDVLAKLSSWLGGCSPFCGDNGRLTAQVRERRSLRCRHF